MPSTGASPLDPPSAPVRTFRTTPMTGLAIRQVAERTGIAAGTIRMWEQRYGFPDPERTASGYRRYSDDDVESLRRVASFRRLGLSIPAAIERVRGSEEASERPSIFAAVSA